MASPISLRAPWAIAVYTWREGIRKKTLIGFMLLSVLVILGSAFMTAFLTGNPVSGGSDAELEVKIIKDICVSAISVFGVLITIFISASVVPTEMDNKVIYTVLSKPLRRYEYLWGKFLGIQMIVIVNLLLMSALFIIALYLRVRVFPSLLLWSTLLTYFQFLIVSAFTFAISCTSTSSVLPTIAGLFIYITGNLTNYLGDVANRAAGADSVMQALVGRIAWLLFRVLPNFTNFDLKDQILYLAVNDPPRDLQLPNLIVYGLMYGLAGYAIAMLVFSRKEL